jgi:hypothetical protein
LKLDEFQGRMRGKKDNKESKKIKGGSVKEGRHLNSREEERNL